MSNSNQVLKRVRIRHVALKTIREFFYQQDFLEIDGPQIIPANCVEAFIEPIGVQVSQGHEVTKEYYLQTSPEVHLKRLLCHGADRIFQLSHVFRDGELSDRHLPEFCLLEWYRTGGSLNDLINDCEEITHRLRQALALELGEIGDLSAPKIHFDRHELSDLFQQYAGLDLRAMLSQLESGDLSAPRRIAEQKGLYLRDGATFEDVFHHVMLSKIEPNIGQDRPAVALSWPKPLAALAALTPNDLLFADRFEIYAGGLELANAFRELTDPGEQQRRFEAENDLRRQLGLKETPIPTRFLSDLKHMPPASGIALGVDRLLMYLCKKSTIQSVQTLPWGEL